MTDLYGSESPLREWLTQAEAEKELLEAMLLIPHLTALDFEIVPKSEVSPSEKWNNYMTWAELVDLVRL